MKVQSGWLVIELLVVLTITAVICGAAVKQPHKPTLKSTCREVINWLHTLRTEAMAYGRNESVSIGEHDIRSSTSTRIRSMSFAAPTSLSGADHLMLYSTGVASPISIAMTQEQYRCVLTIALRGRMQCTCR